MYFAKICVEIDLLVSRHSEIEIKLDDEFYMQRVIYEKMPLYCASCKYVGRDISTCYAYDKKQWRSHVGASKGQQGADLGAQSSAMRDELHSDSSGSFRKGSGVSHGVDQVQKQGKWIPVGTKKKKDGQ